MRNQLLISVSFIGALLIAPAYASDTCPEPAWADVGIGKVDRVEVTQGNQLRVKFDWSAVPIALCYLEGSTTGPLPANATVCKSWLSLAMAAQASGKKLILKHNQPNCYPWPNSPGVFTSVYIEK
jgi:hypothetical protein